MIRIETNQHGVAIRTDTATGSASVVTDSETARRRLRCTAEHHEKMARLLAQVGKHRDAAAATEAARRCREQLAA